jgi:class 3 adenylate cyclase
LLAIFAWVTQACTKGQVTHYEIESEASVLPQCSGQYTSAQIVQPEMQPLFKPSTEVKLALECAVYWVRLRFNDSLVGKTLVLSHRHIDTILLVTQNADGALAHLVNGENIVFSKRPIANGEFPSLPFTVPETGEVFLRMASTSNYSLHFRSFKRFRIEQATLFYPKLDNARYFHGIFFGVMVAMILFNLFIYFVYRDYMYLVYTVFMVTQTVYHLSITGFLREFFLPDLPEIAKLAPFFIAGISLMSYIWFSQVYLLSKHYAPRLNKVLNALYIIIIVTSALGFFFFIEVANSILLTCGLAAVTVPFFIAIIGLKQHYRPAIFFLIASVLSYVGYYLFTMLRFELVPSIFLTRYSYQIMFALQGLLFAMGLGDRMNRIKKELALNKIKQAELEREKERELKELLEQQNEMLEKKVTERTAELVEQNKIIEQDKQIINLERKKSDDLLRNILPDTIAVRLKGGEEMIADHFEAVSVFFSDIVGFTSLSSSMHPAKLVTLLNLLFTEFDKLVKEHGLEKIKTIGDAYMCVCGLPTPVDDHAMRMANFASAALSAVEKINEETGSKLAVRVGISSGSAVAGVIGNTKFAYDLWGETVNIASRLESSGEPMKIYTTEAFKNLAESKFNFTFKGMLDLKGMGEHPVYIMNC